MLRTAFLSQFILVAVLVSATFPNSTAQQAGKITTIDGGAGACYIELTVLGTDSKPVYAATVKVHISYGFAGARRLDLEAGTNAEGKVKFTGLPSRVHRPPLEFIATKDELEATFDYDPATNCHAHQEMKLQPKPPETQQ